MVQILFLKVNRDSYSCCFKLLDLRVAYFARKCRMTANEQKCEEEIGWELNDGKLWREKFHLTHVETGIYELRHLLTGSGKSSVGLGPNYESGEVCLIYLITLFSISSSSGGNLSPQILTDLWLSRTPCCGFQALLRSSSEASINPPSHSAVNNLCVSPLEDICLIKFTMESETISQLGSLPFHPQGTCELPLLRSGSGEE